MKVSEICGSESQINITLEPEHPAEIALIKLLGGCEAVCDSNVDVPTNGLLIRATVKKSNSRY